jgi:hypothetical protein
MKKLFGMLSIFTLTILVMPIAALADGGIYASGGGTKTVGETFTVTVQARGAEFDTIQGSISVSGPVDIVSFSGGSATWMPGYSPANGKQFVGIVSATSSFTIATIKLKAKSTGSGAVSVSGVKMVRTVSGSPSIVGTGAGGTTFSIQRALVMPGQIAVTSSTHSDQNTAYEATSISLAWNKPSGVTGFSYLLDQVADTVPQAKSTSTDVTASYPDKEIGTYYFHIRAQNGDGWGPTTHFKITIKEPDAKISDQLGKPSGITIEKSKDFVNNVAEGNFTGVIIKGQTVADYMANVILKPAVSVPEGKSLSIKADSNGYFELLIDFPIPAGYYNLTVQGQNDKVLTPVSDPVIFEISQAKGGSITLLTSNDEKEPIPPAPKVLKWHEKINYKLATIGSLALFVITLVLLILVFLKSRQAKKLLSDLKKIRIS